MNWSTPKITLIAIICSSGSLAFGQSRPAFCEQIPDALLGGLQAPYAQKITPDGKSYCEGLLVNPIALLPPSVVSLKQFQVSVPPYASGGAASLNWCDDPTQPIHIRLRSAKIPFFGLDALQPGAFKWRADVIATWQPNWNNLAAIGNVLAGETLRADEDRWDREGATTWLRWEIRPWQNLDGMPGGILIFAEDITRRKQIEESLSEIPRKLIEAQEQERTRIGRELHDDIGQRLALLAVELQQLHENSLILPDVCSRMGEFQHRLSEIAADIQLLSHELHSAKLQYLGIAGAMRGFCREFGEQQKVEIDFRTHDLPSPVSPDTSLCFYRVLQEAVHNAAKYSGVRHIEVRLWGTSGEIHLTVVDSGAGFDREAAKESKGLGLISMEERLKLLKGTLSIDSQPKRGTTIHARVPFISISDSARAAG